MWAYLRWLRKPSRRSTIFWIASLTALLYTHYQGLFIPAIQGLHLLIFTRERQRRDGIINLAISGLFMLPWFLAVTIPQAQNAIDNDLPFALEASLETLWHIGSNYLGDQWPLMLLLMGVGWLALLKPRTIGHIQRFDQFFLVGLWLLLPFTVLYFGNFFASLLTERKLLVIAPAIALLIGFGVGKLRNPARNLLIAVLLLYGLTTVDYYRVKEPWDQITDASLVYAKPNDLAFAEVGVGQYPLKYYWERGLPEGAYFSTLPYLNDPTMAPTRDPYTYYDALLPQLLEVQQANREDGAVATAWLVFWGENARTAERLEQAGYTRTMQQSFDHIGNRIDLLRYDWLPAESISSFENGMILRAAQVDSEHRRVDLWWSAAENGIDGDYTVSVQVIDAAGQLVAQKDAAPGITPQATSTWSTNDLIFDPKTPDLAEGINELAPGAYSVRLKIYRWTPEAIIDVLTTDGNSWVDVGTLNIN